MTDLIFWYTGWVVWAILGVALFLGCLFAIVIASYRLYRATVLWKGIRFSLNVPLENEAEVRLVRHAAFSAHRKYPAADDQSLLYNWLLEFRKEYEREVNK